MYDCLSFINSVYDDGSKIARLMAHFVQPEMNDAEFPKTSKRANIIKHDPREVTVMCELVEEYARERAKSAERRGEKRGERRGAIMATIEIMQESGATEEMIVNKLKIRYGLHVVRLRLICQRRHRL